MKPTYDITYATRTARCAWCWGRIREQHTVILVAGDPPLTISLHHACWETYRALSPAVGSSLGFDRDWPPERIEQLRIHCGLQVHEFARELGITPDNFGRLMAGQIFGEGTFIRLRALAIAHQFGRAGGIDWGDPRAVFGLRKHLALSGAAFARELGASAQQAMLWDRHGVPRRNLRIRSRLDHLAESLHFDGGMVSLDRLWTREILAEQIASSGWSYSEWAKAARCSCASIRQWALGIRPIHRDAAWHLTRAATELRLSLPQEGVCESRKNPWGPERKRVSADDEARRLESVRTSKWTLDTIRLLGTMPDREVAARIGKSRTAVCTMRLLLGIAAISAIGWDGKELAQTLSDGELDERWARSRKRMIERKRREQNQ
jgi:DNA-binding transcriptional regulator YiaG